MARTSFQLLIPKRAKPDTLSLRIRAARNISQSQLAGELGVDPKTVGCWEIGAREPRPHSADRLIQIARAHGVRLDTAVEPAFLRLPQVKHRFAVGDRVTRRSGPRAGLQGTVIHVSPATPRVSVQWDAGFKRGYEEATLRPVDAPPKRPKRKATL